MDDPRPIEGEDLISRLAEVLADVRLGVIFEVRTEGEKFLLGAITNLGRVIGSVDEEYGWPTPVDVDGVRRIEDIAPGPRRHPVLMQEGRPVAITLQPIELELLEKD